MKKFLLILILLVCGQTSGQSQRLSYQRFTTDIGLSSPEIANIAMIGDHMIMQANGGKLYIYDGYNLIPFLPDSDISNYDFSIAYPLEDGYMFVMTTYGLMYMNKEKEVFYFKMDLSNRYFPIFYDRGKFYKSEAGQNYLFDEDLKDFKVIEDQWPNMKIGYNNKMKIGDAGLELNQRRKEVGNPWVSVVNSAAIEDSLVIGYDQLIDMNYSHPSVIYLDGDQLVATNIIDETSYDLNQMLKKEKNEVIKNSYGVMQADSIRLLSLKNSSSVDPKYFILDALDIDDIKYLGYLDFYSQRGLCYNGTDLWLSSHDGLFYTNTAIEYYDVTVENMISSIHAIQEDDQGNIILAGYGTGLVKFDGHQFEPLKGPSGIPENQYLPGAYKDLDGSVLVYNSKTPLVRIKNGKVKPMNLLVDGKPFTRPGYFIDRLESGQLAIGTNKNGLALVEKEEGNTLHLKLIKEDQGLSLVNVLCFDEDKNGRIWMGRPSTGVAVYDPSEDKAKTFPRNQQNPKSFGMISCQVDERGSLWMGTTKGLYVLEDPEKFDIWKDDFFESAKRIELPHGGDELVTSLIIRRNQLVVGCASSVSFLDLDNYYQNKLEQPEMNTLLYGVDINGDGTEQNCLMLDKDENIWVGSQSGISKINMDRLRFDKNPVEIELTKVLSGDSILQVKDDRVSVPKDNRNLEILYGPKSNPSLKKNIFFDHFLINKDGDTIDQKMYNRMCKINLSYIPVGDYTLYIKARKNGLIRDELVAKIEVPRSLAESPWFWVGLSFIILGGIASIFILRGRYKTRMVEKDLSLATMKNEKDNLHIQAIISSFNPHFINNSLHWIQSRYRKDETLVKLVGNLSRNIQYIFKNSRKGISYHSLEEEINLVKNYVAVQNIRFENTIDFQLPSHSLQEKYRYFNVIMMQLQIHVENAIEHGLRNREGSRLIRIDLIEVENGIQIQITDDGVGRKKAIEIGSGGTQQGTMMLWNLHEIYNKRNQDKIKTSYEDGIFHDDKQTAFGTKVILDLPKSFKYELEA